LPVKKTPSAFKLRILAIHETKYALYQVALIEVRKAVVGAHLRVRPLVGGHMGPPLHKKKVNYLYDRNLVSRVPRLLRRWRFGFGFGLRLGKRLHYLRSGRGSDWPSGRARRNSGPILNARLFLIRGLIR